MAKERANNVRLPMVPARGRAAAANNISLSLSLFILCVACDGLDTMHTIIFSCSAGGER